ncbi:MAG: hypothetical protein ISR85_02830 [Kiritimatiellales bacterium]|nr:hypothetical protein [Kiritimatiellota bacterium]MBL7011848.1 hypothetical protein [Kiritimatiellales bacterium]
MSNSTFDYRTCFNQAWETYKKHLLLLTGATLVAIILTSVSLGILTGPITAGLITLIFKLMDNDPCAKFEDIFSQFGTFQTTFLLCLVWSVAGFIAISILMFLPLIGQLASIVLGLGLCAFLTFAVLQAALKGMDFIQASKSALEMIKKDFWVLIGYVAVAEILGNIGIIACGIGLVFTMPMFFLMLATAYRSYSAEAPAADLPAEPAEPVVTEPIAEDPAAEPVPEEPPSQTEPEEPKGE